MLFKQWGLMGRLSKNLEDSSAEINVHNGSPVQEMSEGNNNSNWARDYSCDIWAKNQVAFCLCHKNLLEAT